MPSEKRAVNTVFFQDELQFLAQGLIDLPSNTSQQLFPRHGERLKRECIKQRQNNRTKTRRMNYLTIRVRGG
jgi:hypothetical protein